MKTIGTIILAILFALPMTVTAQTKDENSEMPKNESKEIRFFDDYKFWFGSLATIFSVISLILSLKSNKRSKTTENRTLTEDKIKNEAALLLFLCETAASESSEIKNRSHPEWRDLSVDLQIGRANDINYSICYIHSYYQKNPSTINEKTLTSTWEKWYFGIEKFENPLHIYALFGELPKLLKRPGEISFEIEKSAPEWIQKEFINKEKIIGIKFNVTRII
jgi:hypothetical protein